MRSNEGKLCFCIIKAEGWDYYTLLGLCQGIPGVLDRVLSPQQKTVIEKLKNVQQRVTKMITRLRNLTNEERLKEAGLFSMKKRSDQSSKALQRRWSYHLAIAAQ